MIIIVKDGLVGKVYFTCKNCECEFIADVKDCEEDWDHSWVIKCPQCHSECTSYRGTKIVKAKSRS